MHKDPLTNMRNETRGVSESKAKGEKQRGCRERRNLPNPGHLALTASKTEPIRSVYYERLRTPGDVSTNES